MIQMANRNTIFAFDLDGTITREETLPLLANELGLSEEMRILTDLTMNGKISFEQSFRLRFYIIRNISLRRIREIMESVSLDPVISSFITKHRENSAVLTGNLDVWAEPVVEKLGCRMYSSVSIPAPDGNVLLKKILDKGETVRNLKENGSSVIAIGDGANDIPMLEAADVAISYGGVHEPAPGVMLSADYHADNGVELCSILEKYLYGNQY